MDRADFTQEQIQKARLLADTDAGQQLKKLLQRSDAQGLKQALDQAGCGDCAGAKQTLEAFRTTAEAAALLKQLREEP